MEERASVFFGYPSRPAIQREAVVTAARRIGEMGLANAVTWESLRSAGRIVIDKITEAIRRADVCAFDITDLNQNVMFELGYAIGQDKRIWLLRDTTLIASKRKWDQVGLLSVVEYDPFTSSDHICAAFAKNLPYLSERTLFQDLIAPALQPGGSPSIFYIPSIHSTEASRVISTRIRDERARGLRVITADARESSVQPLAWYAQEIAPAATVVVHFTSPSREFADVHNARSALIAGLAYGMGRPLLMLAEEDYLAPIDYRGLLKTYGTTKECREVVDIFFRSILPRVYRELERDHEKAVQRVQVTQLRALKLGEHVAENEEDSLPDYFVETASFDAVLSGRTTVFVGRKGAGKTANFFQAARRLTEDPRQLVASIKPVSYEWKSLLHLAKQFERADSKEYLLHSLWMFLLESEIANAAISAIRSRPSGLVYGTPDWELVQFADGEGAFVKEDFAVRLERAVQSLEKLPNVSGVGDERAQIAAALEQTIVRKLRGLLGRALRDKTRVAVLVDNLDKAWEEGVDFDQLSRFLISLLTASTTLAKDFAKSDLRREPVPLTLAVFIRSDIFERVLLNAREPDKMPTTRLTWQADDMLLRVVERRYAVKVASDDGPALWDRYFCAHVRGQPTRRYIATRVLPRPRDVVFLCNAAITVAVNRGHRVVEESDLMQAERLYSQFAFEAAQVEDEEHGDELERALYEFVGATAVVSQTSALGLIGKAGLEERAPRIIERMRSLSFLGIETGEGQFSFTDEPRERQVAERLAAQLAQKRGAEIRYKIHAAFRPYLEIADVRKDGALD